MFLKTTDWFYQHIARPWLFRSSAERAHHNLLKLAALADASSLLCLLLKGLQTSSHPRQTLLIGGARLASPLILAAGFVKGLGFSDEAQAISAVRQGINIIPGWRAIPQLLGAVEFGSYTRYPRLGNAGTTLWRHAPQYGIQNRVGLKNPGARAAALFLASKTPNLPPVFGINIAPSPGLDDERQEEQEILEAFDMFLEQGVRPTWFTLNLSCPNTEDDPLGHQTEEKATRLCEKISAKLHRYHPHIPLWLKISPNLSQEQYHALAKACHHSGVAVIIATNTLPAPAPDNPQQIAGMAGQPLHPYALKAVQTLAHAQTLHGYPFDIIGCGGVLDGQSYQKFVSAGAKAVQYWSALVYRGPLAPALILSESR